MDPKNQCYNEVPVYTCLAMGSQADGQQSMQEK